MAIGFRDLEFLLYGCLKNFPRPFRSGDLSIENIGLRGTLD
jgi:hypothetical protein